MSRMQFVEDKFRAQKLLIVGVSNKVSCLSLFDVQNEVPN